MPNSGSQAQAPLSASAKSPLVQSHFHADTNTVTHIVSDPVTRRAVIIDPVLDFDPASARIGTDPADRLLHDIREQELTIEWILETHIHADHISGAHYLKGHLGAPIGVSVNISKVQKTFGPLFSLPYPFSPDGRQFDRLFKDGDELSIGELEGTVLATPGHTPACVSYLLGDAVFVGDTLFMPDYGTARCDFPGGDAGTLYDSIQRILSLPEETRMFLCHDYPPDGRAPTWETTVRDQRVKNLHIATSSREGFIEMRSSRDANLGMPQLILPSIQLNMQAGEMPPKETNGIQYLKIPINQF